MTVYTTLYESPIGVLSISATEKGLLSLQFADTTNWIGDRFEPGSHDIEVMLQTKEELSAYFNGRRKHFTIPLTFCSSEFQQKAWRELMKIPFGATISYAEQARRMGVPKAGRAVGSANGKNPFVIIVPCHRVIGSNGKLTGYGSGLWRKIWLLKHEGAILN